MNDALKVPCRTLSIRTISHRLVRITFNTCAALWTVVWQVVDFLLICTPLYNRLDDLGDYFSRPLYEYPVTNAQIFALDIAFVV